jgi:hypothetical protein
LGDALIEKPQQPSLGIMKRNPFLGQQFHLIVVEHDGNHLACSKKLKIPLTQAACARRRPFDLHRSR